MPAIVVVEDLTSEVGSYKEKSSFFLDEILTSLAASIAIQLEICILFTLLKIYLLPPP